MTAGALGLDLLVGAATVLAAIVAARLAHSAGLPALLVFLGLGLALGESGLGIKFDNANLTETLGLGALVLILAEGGLTTNWAHARKAAPVAIAMLDTAGIAVSLDMDFVDPADAPGVGTPVRGGVTYRRSCFLVLEPLEGGIPAHCVHPDETTEKPSRDLRGEVAPIDSGQGVGAAFFVLARKVTVGQPPRPDPCEFRVVAQSVCRECRDQRPRLRTQFGCRVTRSGRLQHIVRGLQLR